MAIPNVNGLLALGWIFVLVGVVWFIQAFVLDYFVNEDAGPASEEEKIANKATPLRRLCWALAGLASFSFGAYVIMHSH